MWINDIIFNNTKSINCPTWRSHKRAKCTIKRNKFIITILGNNGSGKSTFSALLAYELQKHYNKILVLDFDFFNNNLHTIWGVKKNNNELNYYDGDINKLIVKITKKVDLISDIKYIFKNLFWLLSKFETKVNWAPKADSILSFLSQSISQ